MATNPERSKEILQKTSEIGRTIWNCVLPKKVSYLPLVIAHGVIDGFAIRGLMSIPKTGDVTTACILTGIAVLLHYNTRRDHGDWRSNNGEKD